MKSLSLSQPHIIAVIGVPGSGKTFFAEKFTETFHAPYVEFDTIMALSGSSNVAGKRLFHHQLKELLKTKQSVIIEGVAETRVERNELRKLAQSAGYEVLLVWVQIDADTARRRASKKLNDSDASGYTDEEYDRAVKRFSAPVATETFIVISGKHTYASQTKVVLKRLSTPRTEVINQTVVTAPARDRRPQPRTDTPRSDRHSITIT